MLEQMCVNVNVWAWAFADRHRPAHSIMISKGAVTLTTLLQLASYNAWANQRVFETCVAVSSDQLGEEAKGTYGSIAETLAHVVEVEDVYRLMLLGRDPKELTGGGDYMQHDAAWFAERSRQLGNEYVAMLDKRDSNWLESTFVVPWFDMTLTRRDGLLQTWMHSAQHRAQVLSTLGVLGFDVPDVDYIFMLTLERDAAE